MGLVANRCLVADLRRQPSSWGAAMKSIVVRKLRTATVYKLVATGAVFGLVPVFVVFGVLGAMGLSTLTWNGQPVTGPRAIIAGPLMGVMFALICTALFGSAIALGLWIYSKFRTLNLEYEQLATEGDSPRDG
jgi:hypothetical protein